MSGRFGFWPCCQLDCDSLASATWRVVLSGISDGSGSDCADFIGTHDIDIAPEEGEGVGICRGCLTIGDVSIQLLIRITSSIGSADLTFHDNADCDSGLGSTVIATYELTGSNVPASSTSLEFTKTDDPAYCNGFPSSLTITAV